MKIAIPSSQPDMKSAVAHKLGSAAYILIVETEDLSFQVLDGPKREIGSGAGITTISLAINKGAQVILAGYVSPHVVAALKRQSIEIITDYSGTVDEAVADYLRSKQSEDTPSHPKALSEQPETHAQWKAALRKGGRQFYSLLPRLVGVVLLLGLFRGLVDEQTLPELLSGSTLLNSFWGASLGSILAGNPINSYVIGKDLLNSGVGMAGITALMIAWVNVGVIQLPVEASALGLRFALTRNLAAFVMAIAASIAFVMWQGVWA